MVLEDEKLSSLCCILSMFMSSSIIPKEDIFGAIFKINNIQLLLKKVGGKLCLYGLHI